MLRRIGFRCGETASCVTVCLQEACIIFKAGGVSAHLGLVHVPQTLLQLLDLSQLPLPLVQRGGGNAGVQTCSRVKQTVNEGLTHQDPVGDLLLLRLRVGLLESLVDLKLEVVLSLNLHVARQGLSQTAALGLCTGRPDFARWD